ncbi:MAG: hypothetical protein J6Y78_09045 [Paludibacteraceae bacterium]|nr:hypothetical protein [Paludibacteraceae bacterium]
MNILFSDMPVYCQQVEDIVQSLADKFETKKTKRNMTSWNKNCGHVQDIYDGTFTRKQFSMYFQTQLDLSHNIEKIRSVKGDWNKVKELVLSAFNNLRLADNSDRMPYNKKFVRGVKFADFFEGYSYGNPYEITSPFFLFVSEPPQTRSMRLMVSVNKLADDLPIWCQEKAKEFCEENYSKVEEKLHFYVAITDFCLWIRNLRKHFPSVYQNLLTNCEEGNPFLSFKKSLLRKSNQIYGNGSVHPEFFNVRNLGETGVSGFYFKNWLEEQNAKSSFKGLPKKPWKYYSEDDWNDKPIKKKEVIDFEDFAF